MCEAEDVVQTNLSRVSWRSGGSELGLTTIATIVQTYLTVGVMEGTLNLTLDLLMVVRVLANGDKRKHT